MNKSELINQIGLETTLNKKDVTAVVESMIRIITRKLRADEAVRITGFGTFGVSRRPERMGINPSTKQKIKLAATRVPRFKAGKVFKHNMNSSSTIL
jgi:DNA-binding protein HU-beta